MVLELHVDAQTVFDEETSRFFKTGGFTLSFEHSLHAISLWEMKYRIPFVTSRLEGEQFIDYVCCMSLEEDFRQKYLHYLEEEHYIEIAKYLNDTPTATTITNTNGSGKKLTMTSEVVYAYMASGQIPFECDKWNFHRLLMLIRVIGELNNPDKKKMSEQDALRQQAALNAQRKAQQMKK